MIVSDLIGKFNNTQAVLTSFATAQLTDINTITLKNNTFNLFVVTAFFNGAMTQLGKQSTLPAQLQNKYLHDIICDNFKLPRHNAEGLVSSIARMMRKYYFLENIYNEGHAAAEKWLNSDTLTCNELATLLHSYQGFTMLDMKSAGLKEDYSPNQPPSDSPLNAIRSKKRPFYKHVALLVLTSVILSAAYYWYYAL